ncbi:MAG: vitamin K epoxide reductase family protein [Cyanobacteria bacterium P01_D01_bin.105]
MRRRRQETLWIHRWSRPIIGGIATVGALGTGYLTVLKLQNVSACGGGCGKVLSSKWADIFGQPLTLLGCLAYLSMLVLAVSPLLVSADNKDLRVQLEQQTRPLLLLGAVGMTVFSAFLMFVLATDIKAVCPYCIASALMSTAMLVLVVVGNRWEDGGKLVFNGAVIAMLALVATLGLYAAGGQLQSSRGTLAQANAGPAITTQSGEAEVALAAHLTEVGAKMYGAYWCPHCHDQKQLFGQTAAKDIPYVECAADGINAKPGICQAEGITSYPIWKVNGEELRGTQTLESLALASGYEGPSNFSN